MTCPACSIVPIQTGNLACLEHASIQLGSLSLTAIAHKPTTSIEYNLVSSLIGMQGYI